MKTIFKTLASVAVSSVISLSSISNFVFYNVNASTEDDQNVTISFNYTDEGVTVVDDATDLIQPADFTTGATINIPEAELELAGYTFSGWSDDGIHLYEPGDAYQIPAADAVMQPIWIPTIEIGPLNDFTHTVEYNVLIDGEEPENGAPITDYFIEGQAIIISTRSYMRDGYTQMGWTDGTNVFKGDTKIFMGKNDLTFEPNWLKYYNCWYRAGDVDRINGSTAYVFERYETNPFDIATSDRFSRTGFNLTGWLCDYDNQIYRPGANYIMPGCDVTFTAVWTPKTYTVLFKSNNGKNENIKISGETDSAIIVPECESTNDGYVFAGWSFNGTIYQPGEEFIIPGALPGLGISLSAVWEEEVCFNEVPYDSISFVYARQMYAAGEITEDELQKIHTFILNK